MCAARAEPAHLVLLKGMLPQPNPSPKLVDGSGSVAAAGAGDSGSLRDGDTGDANEENNGDIAPEAPVAIEEEMIKFAVCKGVFWLSRSELSLFRRRYGEAQKSSAAGEVTEAVANLFARVARQ